MDCKRIFIALIICGMLGCISSSAEIVYNYPDKLKRSSGTELRVLSYNILARRWGRAMRKVEERAPEITEIIRTIAPDVGGLQELDPIWYQLLESRIKPWKFAGKPGRSTMCAVIYNSNKFRQLDGGLMPFTDSMIRCLRWALLQEIASGRKLLVTNTHWDLTVPKRMKNSELMVKYIKELQKSFTGVPICSTGDFNSQLPHKEYQYLLKNSSLQDAVATAEAVENSDMASYHDPRKKLRKPNQKRKHIDHILFTPDFRVLSCKLVLGDLLWDASDHLPVVADVIYKQKK